MTNRREFMQIAAAGAATGVVGTGSIESARAAVPSYVIPSTGVPTLPIVGAAGLFPVRRIYCMGLNYKSHVAESNMPEMPPFYFMKAPDQLVENNSTVRYPSLTKNYHFELELVVAIGKGGANISRDKALDHVYGYAVGLDMTRRDLQTQARDRKLPWEIGKSFDQSAPCTAIWPVGAVGHVLKGRLQLRVNGEIKQDADVSEMITDVPGCIAYISSTCELMPGDLIYTGTPAGVGPVVSGDVMVGLIEKLGTLTIKVA